MSLIYFLFLRPSGLLIACDRSSEYCRQVSSICFRRVRAVSADSSRVSAMVNMSSTSRTQASD
jgi:hypothetical protein